MDGTDRDFVGNFGPNIFRPKESFVNREDALAYGGADCGGQCCLFEALSGGVELLKGCQFSEGALECCVRFQKIENAVVSGAFGVLVARGP